MGKKKDAKKVTSPDGVYIPDKLDPACHKAFLELKEKLANPELPSEEEATKILLERLDTLLAPAAGLHRPGRRGGPGEGAPIRARAGLWDWDHQVWTLQ